MRHTHVGILGALGLAAILTLLGCGDDSGGGGGGGGGSDAGGNVTATDCASACTVVAQCLGFADEQFGANETECAIGCENATQTEQDAVFACLNAAQCDSTAVAACEPSGP